MNNYRPFIARTIIFLLVILLIRELFSDDRSSIDNYYKSDINELACSIILEGGMYYSYGKPVGFNYEMLSYFADYNNDIIKIDPPQPSPACWDSLINGNYDILVISTHDSIPKHYLNRIYTSVPIQENNVWAVSKKNIKLLNEINFWFADFKNDRLFKQLKKRYFRSYKIEPYLEQNTVAYGLSPYDAIVKKYGKYIGMDWRLLSSLIYEESRYYMGVESNKSAKGLMQIKASTAEHYGVENIYDPDLNIKAGSLHIQYLLEMFKAEGLDSTNVIKFTLAAYNAGEGRIADCRKHAASKGFNPDVWEEVSKSFSSMPSFSGKVTINYVNDILDRYEKYKTVIK